MVSQDKSTFEKITNQFSDNDFSTEWVNSAQDAILQLDNKKFDLFIISEDLPDMTGRQLIEKALFQNAMMNSVVLSQLTHKEFHEIYEGLGVLMQFPLKPETKDVQNLMKHLDRINNINLS